jgi:capsular polysaccharide biosynthesis protein
MLIIFAVVGALVGSGINLLRVSIEQKNSNYVSETKYYIEFAPGVLDAADYYNDYTWNDVIGTDLIMGRIMELLGAGFERNNVKSAIEADIVSDVRYLKITIKGTEKDYVAQIESAFEKAVSEFGENMNEFTRIYKIEDLGISKEEIPNFSVRAAALGMFVFFIVALFVVSFNFCIGSSFYTKRDIMQTFCVPVFGIEFKDGVYEGAIDKPCEKYNDMFYYDGEQRDKLVVAIPFARPCREKIMDEVCNLNLKGFAVSGAVLTQADKRWYKIYRS